MGSRKQIDKRNTTFLKSDSPLTSKRVSIMLSSPKDSKKLAGAVRAVKNAKSGSFKVSKDTHRKIKEASRNPKSA